MLIIFFIAAFIALIVSVSKAVKALKKDDIKSAQKWALIALLILLGYVLIAWIFTKLGYSNFSQYSTSKGGFSQLGIQQNLDKKNRVLDDAEFTQDVTLESHRANVGTISFKKGEKIKGILIDNQTPNIYGSKMQYAPYVIGKFEFTFEGEPLYVDSQYINNNSALLRMSI